MIERKCVQCGKKFTIADSEIEFYKRKNLNLPKRCKECRNKNKSNEKKNESNADKNEYIKKEINKAFTNDVENIAKESGSNKGIWKTLIASFAVIIGLTGGWLSYNVNQDADSNISSVQDEAEIDSSISSVQNETGADNKNITIASNEGGEDSDSTSGRGNTNSDKRKQTSGLYKFRTSKDLKDHFKKHGSEFPYEDINQYLEGANKVINSPDALHKQENEDNDDIYYLESSNEFVIVSVDGYIRTYFKPSDGIAYYNRQ